MLAGLTMPSKKTAGGEKYTEQVKLTKTFKRRLQRVADHEGMHIGEMIEFRMKQFVNSMWLKIVEEDRLRDEKEAAELRSKS